MALALRAGADRDHDLARGVDLDAGALEGADAGTFGVAAQPEAQIATFGACLLLALADRGWVQEPLLVAVSLGAVFMGAMTYIGNGPNFMVKAIAEEQGVRMPSFFGYMAYSMAILVPIFVVVTFVFFRD